MKNINKLVIHPNYAMRKSIFLSICVFFVCLISMFFMPTPTLKTFAANEYTHSFTVVTDNEYENTSGGRISSTDLVLNSSLLKPYLGMAKTSLNDEYTVVATANSGFLFLGWYYAEDEFAAYEQRAVLISVDSQLTVDVTEVNNGFYIAYFATIESLTGTNFYNDFEAVINYQLGYDATLIEDYIDYVLDEPADASGNSFNVSLNISQYMTFRLDLVRHDFVFESYDEEDFSVIEDDNAVGYNTYSKAFVNNNAYNNFSAEDEVTYRFTLSPRLLSTTILWQDQRYYNVSNGLIESTTTLQGYYGEYILDDLNLEYLSNEERLTFPTATTIYDNNNVILAEFNLRAYLLNVYTEANMPITRAMISEDSLTFADNIVSGSIQDETINSEIYAHFGLSTNTNCIITFYYVNSLNNRVLIEGEYNLADICRVGRNINLVVNLQIDNWDDQIAVNEVSGVYNIATINELVWFMKQVNGGNTFAGKTINLTADIDLEGKNWIPIGLASFAGLLDNSLSADYNGALRYLAPQLFQTSNGTSVLGEFSSQTLTYSPFKGTFNGQGHTVSNVNMFSNNIYETNVIALDSLGFFGCVEDALIYNLKINNVDLSGGAVAGGLVGVCVNSRLLNNRMTNVQISFPISYQKDLVLSAGGAVGVAFNSHIEKILSNADFNFENVENAHVLASYVGGVVGESYVSQISEVAHNGAIAVQYKNIANNGYSYIAGIVATNIDGDVEHCVASTTISLQGNNSFAGIVCVASNVQSCVANINDETIYSSMITIDLTAVGVSSGGSGNNLVSVNDVYILSHGGISSQFELLGEEISIADLLSANTYATWDTNIWNIEEGSVPTLNCLNNYTDENIAVDLKTYWEDQTATPITPIGDVYTIENVANLVWIMQQVNSGINEFENKTILLNADLDLSAHEWTPIGVNVLQSITKIVGEGSLDIAIYKYENGFKGIFDGNNKTISGLRQTRCVNNVAGLFGNVVNAVLKNTIIEDANINCRTSVYTLSFDEISNPTFFVGGLAGIVSSSDIIECSVETSNIQAFGLASVNTEHVVGILSQLTTPVMVSQMRFSQLGQNATCVGALVGLGQSVSLVQSLNSSSVSGVFAGGMMGYAQCDVSISGGQNDGVVKGVVAGGILGAAMANNVFEKVWSFGISVSNLLLATDYYDDQINIADAHNNGRIIASAYAGGIVGVGEAFVNKCFNSAEISAVIGFCGLPFEGGVASFGGVAGGIAGMCESAIDCFNTANVISYAVPIISYTAFKSVSAGVAGRAKNVERSYNNGTITSHVTRESLSFSLNRATEIASGIVAIAHNELTIKNVFNVGTVEGESGHCSEIFGVIANFDAFNKTRGTNLTSKSLNLLYAYISGTKDAYCLIEDGINVVEYSTKAYSNSTIFTSVEHFNNDANWIGESPWDFESCWTFETGELASYAYPILQDANYFITIYLVEDSGLGTITFNGDGFYQQGQAIKLTANYPENYFAMWKAPTGQLFFSEVLDFNFNTKFFGEYELSILPYSYSPLVINAVLSDAVGDSVALYADKYGIRTNVIVSAVGGVLTTAGLSNVLPSDIIRNNNYIRSWNTSADGTGTEVNSNTDFAALGTNTIYAIWSSDYYRISASATNGQVTTIVEHNEPYVATETINITTANNYGFVFSHWAINGIVVDSNNEIYGTYFDDVNLSLLTGDLVAWFGISGADVIMLEAVYVPEEITFIINTNNNLLGNVAFDEIYDTIIYGAVISVSATVTEGAMFQYWLDEDTGVKYYTQNGLIVVATRNISLTAYFAENGHVVNINASSNIILSHASFGANVVENGDDFAFSFIVPEGYYLYSITIDRIAQELNNNISLENITADHEIVIVAKRNADVYINLESSVSGVVVLFNVQIGQKSFYFSLEHGQTKRFSGIAQMQTVVFYVSVPTRYDFDVEKDGAMLIENSFTTNISQNINVFVGLRSNDYLTGSFAS